MEKWRERVASLVIQPCLVLNSWPISEIDWRRASLENFTLSSSSTISLFIEEFIIVRVIAGRETRPNWECPTIKNRMKNLIDRDTFCEISRNRVNQIQMGTCPYFRANYQT